MAIIYENLGEVATNHSVIPNTCLTFAEQSLYVAEFAEENFNKLFESVGIDELAVFESTGSLVVYEGAKLQAFKDAASSLFKKIWGTIKSAYEKVLAWFEEKRKESVKNFVALTAADVSALDAEKVYGKTHEFTIDAADDFVSNAQAIREDAISEYNKIINGNIGTSDSQGEKAKEVQEKYAKMIPGKIAGLSSDTDSSDVTKKLHNLLLGEEVSAKKEWIRSHIGDMTAVVLKGNSKNDIKKSYTAEKKNIDKVIGDLKKMDDKHMVVAKYEIGTLKSIITHLHTAMSVKMDICKRRYGEYRNILAKVYAAKKKSTNESFSYTDQQDLVNQAFNW